MCLLLLFFVVSFFVVAFGGAWVRSRLRVFFGVVVVLVAVGSLLGSLAGRVLAVRCALGRLGAGGGVVFLAVWGRALSAVFSSRWAGSFFWFCVVLWLLAVLFLFVVSASLRSRVR